MFDSDKLGIEMTTQEFIFDIPLYQKIDGDDAKQIINDLSSLHLLKVDGYNAQRRLESTYTIKYRPTCGYNTYWWGGNSTHSTFEYTESWYVTLECCRYGDNIDIMILLNAEDKSIMKVGQYPSIADIHIHQIKQYKNILSKDDLKEFTRAVGLAANGIGIGSFVYLRRIFEKLIYSAYEQALSDGNVTEKDYNPRRMDEKIALLCDYLPDTLVEIKHIYGILSKGIHELSEGECLTYFDAVKMGIEIILDDRLEQKKKEQKRQNVLTAVSQIHSKLSK